ncbi:UDP-glucose 4-epimerase [Candidatus Hepatoplasma crinochetorum Av]|uniref:UDP-glucose 4-epimerase n=1 Tax=Candidatus Hepatoplasma crinochetorum Av TaxID=1427984 RepID=W8GJW1_9MOLU|nr:UDP-glucose 4-epimerase GalE [Candidatus Hepatoplasma crinochetorum]AHK22517.1 UDP-glucose 4-epimerase [Candidatus Hepatoplasma crinochetorum Av]
MENRTILITGGLGYIGKNITNLLLKNNYKIIVIDNLINSYEQKIRNKNYKFIKCDILNKNKLNNVFKKEKIDLIIHTAGLIKVQESEEKPIEYFNVNISGTINILEMMQRYNIDKIIFSSSAAVYGNPIKIPIEEKDPKNPINTYGLTKLIGEKLILKAKNIGIKSIIFRYFNIAGGDQKENLNYSPKNNISHYIPKIANAIKNNEIIKIFGNDYQTKDKTCVRDYININDLANIHLLAIDYLFKKNKSEILNVGSGKGYSNLEIIKIIENLVNKKINYKISNKRRKGDPDILIANINKIEKKLNWKNQKNIIDTIKEELNL